MKIILFWLFLVAFFAIKIDAKAIFYKDANGAQIAYYTGRTNRNSK
jgi:hypothetical protein